MKDPCPHCRRPTLRVLHVLTGKVYRLEPEPDDAGNVELLTPGTCRALNGWRRTNRRALGTSLHLKHSCPKENQCLAPTDNSTRT